MSYKSITKSEILSIRVNPGWKSALKEVAKNKGMTVNQMLFEMIDQKYRIAMNPILNRGRKVKMWDSVEEMPLNP